MISVCIQGGATRSIYCIGAVRALTERRSSKDVSAIHAASAGCVAGAVLAGQLSGSAPSDTHATMEEFLGRLAGKRFIDERRLSGVVDVDYLVDVIRDITKITPLSLASQGITFEVAATNARNAQATYFDLSRLDGEEALTKALLATMAIPVLYRLPVVISDVRYVDGGIVDPLPVFRALLHEGVRTVVAISNVPFGELAEEAKGKEKVILRVAPGISQAVRNLMLTRNPLADATETALSAGTVNGVRLVHVSPSRPELLTSRTEVDKIKLRQLEAMGYEDAVAAFDKAGLD